AAVIAMMSVSEGARREALAQVALMGLDNLVVRSRGPAAGSGPTATPLTARGAQRLLPLVPWARAAAPPQEEVLTGSRGAARVQARVTGVGAAYPDILGLTLGHGRFLSAVDERTVERVAVIGATLAKTLFGYMDPVGETIRVDRDYYKVIGVLAERAAAAQVGALAWRDLDQAVLVPVSTLLGR